MQERTLNHNDARHTKLTPQAEPNPKDRFFWNLYARCYDSIYHLMPYRKLLWDVLQALDLKPDMKILDAGCGTGNFELFTSEKNIPPAEIEAIDFSPVMLSRALKKCIFQNNASFKLVSLNQKLGYPQDTFDRIVCINVLYALENPLFTLGECLRVLKPGGKIVVADPKPDFKILSLLQDHFSRFANIWGLSRKATAMAKTVIVLPTLGLATALLNIFVINQKAKRKEYHFLREDELAMLFEQNDFQHIEIDATYADQNWLAQGIKVTLEGQLH